MRLIGVAVLVAAVAVPSVVHASADSSPEPVRSRVADAVVPIDWDRFDGAPSDPAAQEAASVVANANRYALVTWYPERFGQQTGRYLDLGGIEEHDVRPVAMEAYALAVTLGTGTYDAEHTGVDEATARQTAVQLATSVAYHHQTNESGGWGDPWQSALWAYYAGAAGWLLWDDLAADDRELVARMVEFEADRFLNYEVPYYRAPDGTVVYPGDTKAEENGWNGLLLKLATAMLPEHRNHAAWMRKNVELTVSALSRHSDLERTDVVNGRPVNEWLNGSNIEENGTLINHSRIHPDYLATVAQNMAAPLLYTLAGKSTPEAALWNASVAYGALTDVAFTSPPYEAPGGTVYVRTAEGEPTDQIYYPQGNDWGTSRRAHFAMVDTMAGLFDFDAGQGVPASEWARVHQRTVLDMQARFDDGRTYGDASEDTYPSREEWVAYMSATAYLSRWIAHQGPLDISDAPIPDRSVAADDGVWKNLDLADQTGAFSIEFDATPSRAGMDAVVGLSDGVALDYGELGAIVRFWTSGNLEVRNGGEYVDTGVSYAAGKRYHFRLDVDVPSRTYSAYVTPEGGSEQTLATDVAFRTEQSEVARLNNLGSRVNPVTPGTLTTERITIG